MTSFSLGHLYSLLTNLWRLCHASGQVGGYVSPRVVWGEEDRGHPGLLREARPQPHGHRVPRCERQKRYYKFEFDKVKLSWSLVFRLHMFIRSSRDSMIVKIFKCPVFLSSTILPANCSLQNFCIKPQIHWGFLHELFKLKEDDCTPLSNSFTM